MKTLILAAVLLAACNTLDEIQATGAMARETRQAVQDAATPADVDQATASMNGALEALQEATTKDLEAIKGALATVAVDAGQAAAAGGDPLGTAGLTLAGLLAGAMAAAYRKKLIKAPPDE
jgi:predicted small secreted protein